ncbi:hypothetical protein [Parasphingorhabdus sp.]
MAVFGDFMAVEIKNLFTASLERQNLAGERKNLAAFVRPASVGRASRWT